MRKTLFSFMLIAVGLLCSTSSWADNVCKIGDTEYPTLQNAIEAVTGSAKTTITLIGDIFVTNTKVANIIGQKDIVLDLAGFTIDETTNSNVHCISVGESASLTIEDSSNPSKGKIACRDTRTNAWEATAYNIDSEGKVIINGGTLINETDVKAFTYVINYDDNKNGNLEINGGKIINKGKTSGYINPAIRLYIFDGGDNPKKHSFLMTGGEVIGQRAVYSQMGYRNTGLDAKICGGHLAGYDVTEDKPERAFDSQLYGNHHTNGWDCSYKNVSIHVYKQNDKEAPRISGYIFCGDMDHHDLVVGSENIKIEDGIFDMHYGLRSNHELSDFDPNATGDDIWKTNRILGCISGGEFYFNDEEKNQTYVIATIQFANDNGTDQAVTADGFTKYTGLLANKEGWEAVGFIVESVEAPAGKTGNWYKVVKYTTSVEDYNTFLTYIADGYCLTPIEGKEHWYKVGKCSEKKILSTSGLSSSESNTSTNLTIDNGAEVTITGETPVCANKITARGEATIYVPDGTELNVGNGGIKAENDDQVTIVVEAGGKLSVGVGGVSKTGTYDHPVEVNSNIEKSGIFMINPGASENTTPIVEVTFATKAHTANNVEYTQFIASPISNGTLNLVDTESGVKTALAQWNYNGGETEKGAWEYLSGWRGVERSWNTNTLYYIQNDAPQAGTKYIFKGTFAGNKDATLTFPEKEFCLFGNSYTAPIDIVSMFGGLILAAGGQENISQAVYMYNAENNRFEDENLLSIAMDEDALFTQIPPMQGYLLYLQKGTSAEAKLNYTDAVWNNTKSEVAMRAPKRNSDNISTVAKLIVTANGMKDNVLLVEGEEFTNDFDNGSDSYKHIATNNFNMYVANNIGNMSKVATDNLEGTIIMFQAGNETNYELSFASLKGCDYVVKDLQTNAIVDMTNDAKYVFTATANTTAPRFAIERRKGVTTDVEVIIPNQIISKGIYTIAGQYVGTSEMWNNLPQGVYVIDGKKIIK